MKLDTVVSDLEYADDMVLVSSSWDDLCVMVQALEKHCTDMGLCISTKKTKIMAVLPYPSCQPPKPTTLRPDEDPIEVVSSFQYLGSILENECGTDAEVSARISSASKVFRSLNRILWYKKRIKTHTKVRLFNSVIMPTLLYGLESLVLTEPQVQHLQSFVMRDLRKEWHLRHLVQPGSRSYHMAHHVQDKAGGCEQAA